MKISFEVQCLSKLDVEHDSLQLCSLLQTDVQQYKFNKSTKSIGIYTHAVNFTSVHVLYDECHSDKLQLFN